MCDRQRAGGQKAAIQAAKLGRKVCIIGTGATELIHIGRAVMALEAKVDYFVDSAFNYPTLAECYRVAALNGINKLK